MKILASNDSSFIPILKHLSNEHELFVFDANHKTTMGNLDVPVQLLAEQVSNHQVALEKSVNYGIAVVRGLTFNYSSNGIDPPLRKRFDEIILRYLYPRLGDLAFLVNALDDAHPDLILLHNDVEPILRVAASWAAKNDVPCLHIPHSLYVDVNRGDVGDDIHDIVTASYIAAYGPFQRNWYLNRGAHSEGIRETGSPKLDRLVSNEMDQGRARKLLKLGQHVPVISFMGTWRQDTSLFGCNDEWQEVYVNALRAVKSLEGAVLIVKVHPRSNEQNNTWYVETAKEEGVGCLLTPSHLEIILHASDLVFAPYGSNVLLEASFVPDSRLMTNRGFEEDEEVIKVDNKSEAMAEAMREALSTPPPGLTEFQYKYAGIPDGNATQRVIEFCEDLL